MPHWWVNILVGWAKLQGQMLKAKWWLVLATLVKTRYYITPDVLLGLSACILCKDLFNKCYVLKRKWLSYEIFLWNPPYPHQTSQFKLDKKISWCYCYWLGRYWAEAQPDEGGGKEDCVHVRKDEKKSWNDLSCSTSLKWICEKTPNHCTVS